MPEKIKTIVAESHTLTRKGYLALLREISIISVVGEAENSKELLAQLNKTNADLVLLDIKMQLTNGRETLNFIKTNFRDTKVVILSSGQDMGVIIDYIKLGACAFVNKDSTYEEFVHVLSEVAEEGFYYDKKISKALMKEVSQRENNLAELTEREKEIVLLACSGKSNKEIASCLNIVVKTVDYHKANIYKKTNTHSNAALYKYARKKNLISEKGDE